MKQKLQEIETNLCELIMDAQDVADAHPDNDGMTMSTPEDAAPELDELRGLVRDMIEAIPEELGYVIELAGHRADMWQEHVDTGELQLNEFCECDFAEAQAMANDTKHAVSAVSNWYRGK